MPGMPDFNAANDGEQPPMEERARSNMYADSFHIASADSGQSRMFGSCSTRGAKRTRSRVPSWAIPSSVNPSLKRIKMPKTQEFVTAADELYADATKQEQNAFIEFQAQLLKSYDYVPDNLDMMLFLKLATWARNGRPSGDP